MYVFWSLIFVFHTFQIDRRYSDLWIGFILVGDAHCYGAGAPAEGTSFCAQFEFTTQVVAFSFRFLQ